MHCVQQNNLSQVIKLTLKFKLTITDQKQVIKQTMIVPEKCTKITISKTVNAHLNNGFKNKVDIAFYDENGKWYGRFDRYKDNFEITGQSTKGCSILPGEWSVFCEVFQLYEEMEITLDITFHCYEHYHTFLGELHTHTNITDGKLSLKELEASISENEHDFFFMTDHNSITAWNDLNKNSSVKGYKGLELTTFSGHILVLGITDYVSWYNNNGDLKLLEQIRTNVKEKGGILGIAHPFANGAPFCAGCRWENPFDPSLFDFIEVWNSKLGDNKQNWEAITLWTDFLRNDYKIFCTCGGDIHKETDLDHSLHVCVLTNENNETSILNALQKGRFYLAQKGVNIKAEIESQTFGQTVITQKELKVFYNTQNCPEKTNFYTITKSGMNTVDKNSDFFVLKDIKEKDFVVFLGIGENNDLVFLTNPIFVEKE